MNANDLFLNNVIVESFMLLWFRQFMSSGRQTKYFILTIAIYMIAIVWSTVQAYARLQYSRSDIAKSHNDHH